MHVYNNLKRKDNAVPINHKPFITLPLINPMPLYGSPIYMEHNISFYVVFTVQYIDSADDAFKYFIFRFRTF